MSESTTIVSALDDAIGLVESESGRRDEKTRAHWVHVARVLQSSRDKIAALLAAEEGERSRRQHEIEAIRFHSSGRDALERIEALPRFYATTSGRLRDVTGDCLDRAAVIAALVPGHSPGHPENTTEDGK